MLFTDLHPSDVIKHLRRPALSFERRQFTFDNLSHPNNPILAPIDLLADGGGLI